MSNICKEDPHLWRCAYIIRRKCFFMQKKTGIDLWQTGPASRTSIQYSIFAQHGYTQWCHRRKKLICFTQKNIHRCGIGERVNLINAFSTFLLRVVEELKWETSCHLTINNLAKNSSSPEFASKDLSIWIANNIHRWMKQETRREDSSQKN